LRNSAKFFIGTVIIMGLMLATRIMLPSKTPLTGMIAIGLFSFWLTYCIVPLFIYRMKKRKITGKDMNKTGFPEVPEMGGLPVMLGFTFGVLLAIFFTSYLNIPELLLTNLNLLLIGLLTILLVGILGILDDLAGWKNGLRQWQHALIPMFAAFPLVAFKAGETTMNLPFIGNIEFGIIYPLFLIPIGITGAANAFNMLAGMNGLETGQGILIITTLSIIAFFHEQNEALIIGIALIGALTAFYIYNKFPAKIFGGDSLTLVIGAGIATMAIIGNMEKLGIALLGLYFIELFYKAKSRFKSQSFGIPQKDGTLAPHPKGSSITHTIMRKGKFTEKKVVQIIHTTQLAICILGLIFYFTGRMTL
jgi:UDP-N-acetylglucosamine--dolichyl-phosphate N-acetylglucosaminephosphotransferase